MTGELDTLMVEFSIRHGLDSAVKDEDGRYYLTLDASLQIGLFQAGERLYLEGRIDALPADMEETEQLLARALKLQLARLREKPEVLSLDSRDGALVLFRHLPVYGLALRQLEAALGALANGLEFWRNILGQARAPRDIRPRPMSIVFP